MKIITNVKLYNAPETLTNIYIQNDTIIKIGAFEPIENAEIIDAENGIAMPFGIDTFCFVGEPGFEFRETIENISKTALAGGFNTIVCLPNTNPCIDSASMIHFYKNKEAGRKVKLYPMGAATQACKGKDLAEIYDMNAHGVQLFGDGIHSIDDDALILRILQYIKPIHGTFVNVPLSKKISNNAFVHESSNSVALGLKGSPHFAEVLAVRRDIELVKYTNSKIHWANITCEESLHYIKQAKAEGLPVTCSVNAMNIFYNENVYNKFDSAYKVFPVIRSEKDRQAIVSALVDGTIDMINTNHQPWDLEHKEVEMEYAESGANTLQFTVLAAWEMLKDKISLLRFNDLININPSKLLNIAPNEIKEGSNPDFFILKNQEKSSISITETRFPSPFSLEKYSNYIQNV